MRNDDLEQLKCLLLKQNEAIEKLKEQADKNSKSTEAIIQLLATNSVLLVFVLGELQSFKNHILRWRFRK